MNILRNLSIRSKLLVIILSVTIPIVIGQAIYNIKEDIEYNKKQIEININSIIQLTGNYCIPDIVFNDKSQALKSLSALKSMPLVMQCKLFDKKGEFFASYINDDYDDTSVSEVNTDNLNLFKDKYFTLSKDIIFNSEKVGSIMMVASTQEFSDNLFIHIKGVFYISFLLILFSLVISFQLQKIISNPLLQLTRLSEKVGLTRDFSLREEIRNNNDEIGVLVNGFNDMLSHIQETTVSKDFVDNIIESMEPIFVINNKGLITKTNLSATELLGLSKEELLNADINNFIESGLSRDKIGLSFDTKLINKSGIKIPVTISITQIDNENMVCLAHDLSERILHENEIKKALAEKEVLLKEIHHRVKNNLQIITSLLNFQSNSLQDEGVKAMFLESQDRIRAMALIHTKLYQSKDLGEIKVFEYFESLISQLISSYSIGTDISLEINTEIPGLDIETIIPLGLITNELMSNSLKHGFKERNIGKVCLDIKLAENICIVEISDDGKGFPDNFDLNSSQTLGLQLVEIFAEQLGGKITHDNLFAGSKFILSFKLSSKSCNLIFERN